MVKRKKKKTAAPAEKQPRMKRGNKVVVSLNDKEMRALNQYCDKYKVKNRSRFLRETIMIAILKKFDEDYPKLFEEEEMQQVVEQ